MRTEQSIALDHYLVTVARMRDQGALGQLAQRWQPRLLRHAQRLLGELEPAREATQEAWLEILRGFMGSHFEANRILRELALVQLKLSSKAD